MLVLKTKRKNKMKGGGAFKNLHIIFGRLSWEYPLMERKLGNIENFVKINKVFEQSLYVLNLIQIIYGFL